MVRSIVGVIVGYVAMFLFIMLTFSIVYMAMGADTAFEEGTYDVSAIWIVLSIVLGLIAAVIGGFICAAISKSRGASIALAIVVFVLGIAFAIPTLSNEPLNEARTADVPNFEAMAKAQTPPWLAFLNPVIGVIGVMAGAGLRKQPGTTTTA